MQLRIGQVRYEVALIPTGDQAPCYNHQGRDLLQREISSRYFSDQGLPKYHGVISATLYCEDFNEVSNLPVEHFAHGSEDARTHMACRICPHEARKNTQPLPTSNLADKVDRAKRNSSLRQWLDFVQEAVD